ncbi:30S RIBOSOMAL PROTEIN S10 FAMILY MEMBER [Salix purpurea]|uniref:30S RIBOSOMAL PROTEIN S10 FAMILY MEMBER n=1 Tax=Salix purpurea TaxID=77065 RepID=A0A9Q0W6P4_SALPP|nr:30S RIBOSOMAL PROTEIN S10 FAMILY MEMBER [Salix purpurea]
MSRQAVSIFSSRISSFSYSQSRSFMAAPPPPPSVFVDKKESGTKMPAISSSSGRNAGDHQEEKPPKAMTTKICIAIRSFEDLVPGNTISGLPADVRKIRLPESRVLYTVLRSPHVDKKSREQFEMRMKKQLLVAKVQSHELRNKYFWLKRQRIFGAQYEIQFHCKTRMDKDKLQKLLP